MLCRMKNILLFFIILAIPIVTACSYTSEKAIKNGDVVNMNGPVFNFSLFETFLENIDQQNPDKIRIANFTPDGRTILYNLNANRASISLVIDYSKGEIRENGPSKVQVTCTNLVVKEGQQVNSYILEGCDYDSSDDSFTILSVAKNQWGDDEHVH